MNELLSNAEIEALLDVFRSEQAHIETARAEDLGRFVGAAAPSGPVVSRVDLCKPNRMTREQLAALERCAEGAARAIGATTSDKLRLEMACDCVGIEQQRFGTLISQIGGPVALYVVRLPPLEHTALLSISTGLLYAAVDRILGGTGKVSKVPAELTAAEYTVADAFVGPCLDHVCRSLDALGELSWEIESRSANASAAQILSAHEVAVSVYFQITGEQLLGDIRLLLPHVMLEPHLDTLLQGRTGAFGVAPGRMRDVVERSMREVDLDFRVQLGEAALTVRDLMALRVGDVVPLETGVGDLLVAPVEGVPKFLGTVGSRGRRLAFRIEPTIH